MSTSTETRIPTETFLLPGQKFCIGLPWEREGLPAGGLAPAPQLVPAKLTLRDEREKADPFAGFVLGKCTVVRRLSEGAARTLLAVRADEVDGQTLVVLRRLELPEVLALEARNHAEWAQRFVHPNLARVFDCELGDEGAFWVTELASGATLAELAALMRRQGQAVPLGLTLSVVLETARALAELHGAGAAHGMVRDQSVAVNLDGSARLLDTGLFRCLAQGPTWLEARELMGPYFAPEQLLEGRLPDPKSDVYSLGVVLYEGLTGELVRRGKSFEQQVKLAQAGSLVPASRLNVAVGPALDEVLRQALSADRSKRFPTARAFADALSEAASAFMWRRELRGQFIARHFEERRRQDEALKELLARTPPPAPRPPTQDLAPVVAAPVVRLHHRAPPLPLALPKERAPRAEVKRAPRRSFAAPLALLLGAALGGFGGVALQPAPVVPAPSPPVVTVAAAPPAEVVAAETQVEPVTLEPAPPVTDGLSSREEAQQAPLAPAPARKVKRSVRRAKDAAPMPPWLMKRSRR